MTQKCVNIHNNIAGSLNRYPLTLWLASLTESFYTMRWLKPNLRSSFMAFLGQGPITPSLMDDRTEIIREFILDELGEFGEKHFPNIGRRVRYAQDVVSLWYTRGDVMAVLSAVHGETIAREKVDRITDQFKGLLPRGLSSRPSPLST